MHINQGPDLERSNLMACQMGLDIVTELMAQLRAELPNPDDLG